MASLPPALRRQLEKTIIAARDDAEAGARAAIERLAVHRAEPFGEMAVEDRSLRLLLRAHAQQLGDLRNPSGAQGIERLVSECAYEHWHRMLFARFLAENRLLLHPEHGVPVTLAECEELAAAEGDGDGWALASRFAARMLPAIFRPDDPVLRLRLAPEHQQALEKHLAGIAPEVFSADDSLGWVYQFWQTKRKKEVNDSGRKIGADELPAVTQLFTEPYMVEFLLHNTLGAWWAGKVMAARPELANTAASEEELRQACALPGCAWTYLRFVPEEREDGDGTWRPAAGTFEGWPERAADITMLDPCCGSGHFVVQGFRILVPLRMAEEGLSPRAACEAVLQDNLFGLEIDERCTQIAAFNLALAAWSYPAAGGYWALPELNIACSGLSVGAREDDWLKLAGNDRRLRDGMQRLYRLFKDAPTLGSLIDPRREFEARPGEFNFDEGRFEELQPLLEQALAREEVKRDAAATEAGIAAQGMAKAAVVLAGAFTLVSTNVPYLGRGKQDDALKDHVEKHFKEGKADLSTAFVLRCLDLCARDGSTALVTPQNWLFLTTYTKLRESLLERRTWNVVARLGPNAFQDMNWWAATTSLLVLSRRNPSESHMMMGIDVSGDKRQEVKAAMLRGEVSADIAVVHQSEQLENPDARVMNTAGTTVGWLSELADYGKGSTTGDGPRFLQSFWERPIITSRSTPWLNSPDPNQPWSGRSELCVVPLDDESLRSQSGCWLRGRDVWGRSGVAVNKMQELEPFIYAGEVFDDNICPICPRDEAHVAAVWAYVCSSKYHESVRSVDQAVKVTAGTLTKAPRHNKLTMFRG